MDARRGLLAGSAVVAVGVFVAMLAGYTAGWAPLTRFDDAALAPMLRVGEAHPAWVTAWDVFCTVLGPTVFRLITIVVIVVAFARRNVRVAMFLIISVELSGLVTEVAKTLVDRPRPAGALVHAASSSFPSGHALGVMVAVCALLTVALPLVGPGRRGWLIALGVTLVVAIGAGRVVLNVHHPSDVIAGWALGYAYFVACLLLIRPVRPITVPDETPAVPGTAR
ncbi:phosphatase PAP2 family protein [Mycolicibacterium rufum]|uniref:Phosphatase PAP2 family protein n=1 Tax=Mycolicibacterium rufum TaxID=318424 RepID=A0A9X3BIH6_9MYCO|nr:phosphatase PAP2 family protein [Mycolicibacterium rufum]KGI66440.1 membrane protein [Mycolicibacterium rufum]MCV7072114.1 phosphatase PAP2 family protein [Mycolicibacterium rufum]ULP37204.1 phosphatase PAP2 family protein [Mycolicibacterium rufum]